ncbi:ABC transporter ATP-binding protein [Pseudoduganella chitinolytica]|uniref:ABC transporter ATP-binding protein n=1 Tax=Pseudoduganella chitinolytica TaxID=34070 RepID=A0ABY8BIR2_9BURK|nr:ABC transporter ATP-binding protein [Pseudoduganella chitinolytica]WEF35820.1 ABC transporter ATP-binding protein [Pseudoduganella chitinolytica]
MAALALRQLAKRYGDNAVIHGVDLDIRDGEFVVFVGPSGCGKSTLLRMIAGLEEISGGELHIGGRLANHVPPARRDLAMVFQSYALYPHMTVYDNMAFALQLAGQKKDDIRAAVQRAADVLQIGHLLARRPKELSGGQRQRVAIGRAIVRQPGLFLFDEPLSNLDASLRVQMRMELARLHAQLKTTMIYVTHDQVEAMTLGERIVVFNGGRIEQVGTPRELYNAPANLFVAGFLGTPKMNRIGATVAGAQGPLQVRLADGTPLATTMAAGAAQDGALVTVGIRPEHLRVAADGDAGNRLAGVVSHVEYLGDQLLVHAATPGTTDPIALRHPADSPVPQPGQAIELHLPPGSCHVFDAQGRALVRG